MWPPLMTVGMDVERGTLNKPQFRFGGPHSLAFHLSKRARANEVTNVREQMRGRTNERENK
jgi:hypothetical protein